MKKPTIRDVAREANVSVATVSRVLNNKGYVYETTRQSVNDAIDKLGFEINLLAKSLSGQKSNIIGIIQEYTDDPKYYKVLNEIEEELSDNGYMVMIFNKNDDMKKIDFIKSFRQYSIDGIVIMCDYPRVKEIIDSIIPVASVDYKFEDVESVTSDEILNGSKIFYIMTK